MLKYIQELFLTWLPHCNPHIIVLIHFRSLFCVEIYNVGIYKFYIVYALGRQKNLHKHEDNDDGVMRERIYLYIHTF